MTLLEIEGREGWMWKYLGDWEKSREYLARTISPTNCRGLCKLQIGKVEVQEHSSPHRRPATPTSALHFWNKVEAEGRMKIINHENQNLQLPKTAIREDKNRTKSMTGSMQYRVPEKIDEWTGPFTKFFHFTRYDQQFAWTIVLPVWTKNWLSTFVIEREWFPWKYFFFHPIIRNHIINIADPTSWGRSILKK